MYLQHSLKNGSAKKVIKTLSCSGEFYVEAIECLKARYDRPRLIHQTHVRMILEAPPLLKDGTGRELHRLHDTVQQHLRPLKAMDYEPSGPFITSVLELKLDVNTMFDGKDKARTTPTFLIITSCSNLSIYALKHPRLHYPIESGTNLTP